MKKALALIMAIAMIASMAAVAMAATQVNPGVDRTYPVSKYDTQIFTYSKTAGFDAVNGEVVPFGKTVYVNLLTAGGTIIKDADAVKGLNVSAKWEKGAEYITGVEIVKTGAVDSDGARYMIAVATTGSSLEDVEVLGEISVKGQSYFEVDSDADGKLEGEKQKVDYKFSIELDLGWATATAADNMEVSTKTVYDFEGIVNDKFDLGFGPIDVVTNVKNMKKVIMAYNDDVNEDLLDAYVDADLVFVNCEANFRRTAEVTVDLADDEYFYEVVDGKLVAVDGEYDDWTEEFTFKTRKLGNYVISDTELVTESVAVANPSTGAAA